MAENLNREAELEKLLFADVVAIDDLADRLLALRDRLDEVVELERRLRQLRKLTIDDLEETGWERKDVGRLLGVSPQRVSQLAK
jgi:transcriptional regulator with XRE-family HTH domain